MALAEFLDRPSGPTRTLVMANRTAPEPFQEMLEAVFEDQDISVDEGQVEAYDDDMVLLVEDGTVVASSALDELTDAILMVNSDLFVTGTRDLTDTTVPAVIEGLSDYRFRLRGYPASNTEKLLLILISRQIEKRAYQHGAGTIRSSFQRLSRVEDEQGTRQVYEQLADSDVDVHLYGQPDWTPEPELQVTIHGGYTRDFEESWFVLFEPPAESAAEGRQALLLAIEQEPGVWDGFWTFRSPVVQAVARDIRQRL